MMVDNPIGDFLINLGAEVGGMLVEAWARRAGGHIYGSEKEQAVRRCLDAGLVAFLHRAQGEAPGFADLLTTTGTFFHSREVVKEITRLLRGQALDHDELKFLFGEAGYPSDGVFDFSAAMKDFEGIFLLRAVEEEALQGTVQAGQLLRQSSLIESQLGLLRQMLAALNTIQMQSIVGIGADSFVVRGDKVAGDKVEGDKVEGDKVEGDKVEGDNVAGNKTVYFGAVAVEGGRILPDHWERHYLQTLISRCDRLDLTTLSAEITADSPTISDVFTPLYLANILRAEGESVAEAIVPKHSIEEWFKARTPKEEILFVTAYEAIETMPRLVILGQPGGGKSTLVNHITVRMAKKRLVQEEAPLPVRIILRRFAEWLAVEGRRGDVGDVWAYINYLLEQWGCADSYEGLRRTFINQGGIIFFDGLDEIREAEKRQAAIKRAVLAFAEGLDQCQVIVTSRPYAYTEKAGWRLPANEFPVVTLAPFNDKQIKAFNRAWYLRVMGPVRDWDGEQCRQLADRLTEAIVSQPHLRRLAGTPLLLTLIAQVNSRSGTLPQNRADLYQQAVNLLLARWNNRIVLDALPGEEVREDEVLWLGVPTDHLRDVLAQLAYKAHQEQGERPPTDDAAAEISHADLKAALVERFDSGEKAEQIITYIQHRAGLLIVAQEEAVYTFPHRTFQEYLAARHLLNQPNWAKQLCDHLRAGPDWWREVFLLSAGIAIASLPDSIPQLLNQLLPFEPGSKEMPLTAETPAWAFIATQVLIETNFNYYVEQEAEAGAFTAVYRRVQSWLKAAMVADKLLAPPVRAEVGRWLIQLGDDRPGVGLDPESGLPDIVWGEEVPPGTYMIGDDDSTRDSEKRREVSIERPYRLARYPITNAQFQAFLTALDIEDGRWWQGIPADEKVFREPTFPFANHPRENISWFQAVAFCRWLEDKLQDSLSERSEIGLPREDEWEVAARWPDDRLYPWGNDFDSNKANTEESGISQTSAVGLFPSCRNQALKLDEMSGNVWEWQVNKFDDPTFTAVDDSQDSRVLRGGAWDRGRDIARATNRDFYNPYNRYSLVGFRVVRRSPTQPEH